MYVFVLQQCKLFNRKNKKTEDNFQFVNKPYDLRNNRILLRKRNRIVFVWNRKSFFFGFKNLGTNTSVA